MPVIVEEIGSPVEEPQGPSAAPAPEAASSSPTHPLPIGNPERLASETVAPLFGVYPALVVDVVDPDERGRVMVRLPWAPDLNRADYEAWARIATLMAGSERGTWFIPDVDDEVLVAFEYEDINRPYVLGALWNGKDKPPESNKSIVSGGKVQKRIIHSRSGHTITLDDTDNSEKISIVDKTEKNLVEIDSKNNSLEIKAGSKVEIHTDDGHKIVVDSNGINIEAAMGKDLTLKGQNIKIEAMVGLDMTAKTGNAKIEGLETTVKGSTKMDLDGGALMNIKGVLVKIN